MNKYVYLVIRKCFYNSHGTDYAMPTDYLDVRAFSNIKKAEAEVKYLIKLHDLENNIPFHESDMTSDLIGDNCEMYKVYAQKSYNMSGLRYAFIILKQKLE